jgi:hypothetical protein
MHHSMEEPLIDDETRHRRDAPLPYEQSLASTDRLGEEIAAAIVFLDRLLLDPRGN